MMRYAYPVVFSFEDGKVLASVPDLPGLHTFGDDLADAPFSQILQEGLKKYLKGGVVDKSE